MILTARQIIKREYGDSRNFMTPSVIRTGKMCRNIAYELSSGTGIQDQSIYGVSIVCLTESTGKTERLNDDSQMFDDYQSALAYIDDYKQRC